MADKELHPSIREFKTFVKNHPGLIKDVKQNGGHWQTYYEKWVLLGEDDPSWEKFKNNSADHEGDTSNGSETKKDNKEIMNQVMKMMENVDLNKVEGHINQLNGAITNIQSLIGQFRDVKKQLPNKRQNSGPFPMSKD
ncbi:YlbD family protein [Radiobacillus sp. PE A8.2]|uniref:YlbD family protein n=1 Tax=Radiobacillus sp. PE A8.2 TaxID=3380349 RepID=UPI00388F0B26